MTATTGITPPFSVKVEEYLMVRSTPQAPESKPEYAEAGGAGFQIWNRLKLIVHLQTSIRKNK